MIQSVSELPFLDLPILKEVYDIVKEAHKDQKRKTGLPYQVHIDAVIVNTYNYVHRPENPINSVALDRYLSLAAAHDVIEDQNDKVTYDHLFNIVRPHLGQFEATEWLESLKRLTKEPGAEYADYIVNLSNDPFASIVKLADLDHNSYDLPQGEKKSKYLLAKAYIRQCQEMTVNKDPDGL